MAALESIWDNDAAIRFFSENDYPTEYNDGMMAWLRQTLNVSSGTLNDLLRQYIDLYGETFNMGVISSSAVSVGYIAPATTFTALTPTDGGGGTIVLTSAGAHGLTAAVAIGKHIYVSAGTGWTAGFYPITAVPVDTTGTAVTVTGTFSGSMGTPTIALAGTEVPFYTISVPILRSNSYLEIGGTWTHPNNANTKRPIVRFNNDAYYNPAATTALASRPSPVIIHNRGVTNSQVGAAPSSSLSHDGAIGAPTMTSIDTSVATTLTIGGTANTANDYIYIERYAVKVFL